MIQCPCVYDIYLNTVMDSADRYALECYIGWFLLEKRELIPQYIILYGDPGSGKSTILYMLYRLFGDDQINYSIEMAKLTKSPCVIIHDGDADKIIHDTINDRDLEKTIFIIATNKLPKNYTTNVKVLCMTGNKIKDSIFDKLIYPGLFKMIDLYGKYCIDALYWPLYELNSCGE